ncbi:cuticle protein 64-like [Pararge aegeria]|nr:cuticle protein 64-like [Pararge aegeria]
MNTYITLACLLAVATTGHGSALGVGWGGLGGYGGVGGWDGLGGWGGSGVSIIKVPILAPAISTQNLIKAAPIPIVKSVAVSPIITAPILKTVPISTVGLGSLGGLGWGLNGGYGYGGLGSGLWGKGWGKL